MSRNQRILELLTIGPQMSEALARALDCPEASIRRNVQELRKQGHRINAVSYPTGWEYRLW